MKYFFWSLACLFYGATELSAQVVLNEIVSRNDLSWTAPDGSAPDWIELYNAGSAAADLSGYFLSDSESNFKTWAFPAGTLLAPGQYLLVAASGEADSPMETNFKISGSGEKITLSDPDGTVLQQVRLPALPVDVAYARAADGSYYYTTQPTPAATNDPAGRIEAATRPVFDRETAFATAPFVLTLSCDLPDCQIRYTTDGSAPDENAPLYEGGLDLLESTSVRAYVEAPGYLPGPVSTRNYFFETPHDLPVIAISTDPANLFDPTEGIFELGPNADLQWPFYGANFYEDTKIPVHAEVLTGDFERLAAFDVGAQTHGGRGAKTRPQKPLRLLAEHQFGSDTMHYRFIPSRENATYERIALRNASGDYGHAHCRDEFLAQYLLEEGLDLELAASRPAAWYINGEYYGITHMREKLDGFYLRDRFGVERGDYYLMEEDTSKAEGSRAALAVDSAFIMNTDLSDNQNFAEADRRFDTRNMADYFIAQTVVNNANWPHNNLKIWRVRSADGRWRYMLFDMDSAAARFSWTRATENLLEQRLGPDYVRNFHAELMRRLLENQEFRYYFINRYADLLNTSFLPGRWGTAARAMADRMRAEMQRHFERWPEIKSYDYWETEGMAGLIDFCETRAPIARDQVQQFFELDHQVQLDLRVYPEGAGRIRINTIVPETLPWTGIYFAGVPVELTIEPAPGYQFSHWQSVETIETPDPSEGVRVDFRQDDAVTAFFSQKFPGLHPSVYPNPVSDHAEVRFDLPAPGNVTFNLYDAAGKLVRTQSLGKLGGGTRRESLSVTGLASGGYLLEVVSGEFRGSCAVVVR